MQTSRGTCAADGRTAQVEPDEITLNEGSDYDLVRIGPKVKGVLLHASGIVKLRQLGARQPGVTQQDVRIELQYGNRTVLAKVKGEQNGRSA
jgi:hypothetical protein